MSFDIYLYDPLASGHQYIRLGHITAQCAHDALDKSDKNIRKAFQLLRNYPKKKHYLIVAVCRTPRGFVKAFAFHFRSKQGDATFVQDFQADTVSNLFARNELMFPHLGGDTGNTTGISESFSSFPSVLSTKDSFISTSKAVIPARAPDIQLTPLLPRRSVEQPQQPKPRSNIPEELRPDIKDQVKDQEIRNLRAQITDLSAQVVSLQQQLGSQNATKQGEIDRIRDLEVKCQALVQAGRSEIAGRESEINRLNDNISELQQRCQDDRGLRDEIDRLSSLNNDRNRRERECLEGIAQCNAMIQQLRTSAITKENELQRALQKIQSLESTSSQPIAVPGLQAQLAALQGQNAQLLAQNNQLKSQNAQLSGQLQGPALGTQAIEKERKQCDLRITEWSTRFDALRRACAEAEQKLSAQIGELTKDKNSAASALRSETARAQQAIDKAQQLASQIAAFARENEQLRGTLQKQQPVASVSAVNATIAENQQLKGRLSEVFQAQQNAQQLVESGQARIAALQGQNQQLAEQVETLDRRVTELSNVQQSALVQSDANKALQGRIQQLQQQLQQVQRQTSECISPDEMARQRFAFDKELKNVRDENAEAQARIQDLETKLQQYDPQINALNGQIAQLNRQNSALQRDIQAWKTNYARVEQESKSNLQGAKDYNASRLEYSQLFASYQALQNLYQNLNPKLQACDKEKIACREQVQQLQGQLQAQKQQSDRLIQELRTRLDLAQQGVADANRERDILVERARTDCNKRLNEIQSESVGKDQHIQTLAQQINGLQNEIEQIKVANREAQRAASRVAQAESKAVEADQRLIICQKAIDRQREEWTELERSRKTQRPS
jgi:chromosome segregation ATPase